MEQKQEFVSEYLRREASLTELCDRFGVSRRTGYKWLARYRLEGQPGLVDRSRARHTQAHRTNEVIRGLLLEARQKHPHWGPRKLIAVVSARHGGLRLPAASTVGELLRQHGLVRPRQVRPRVAPGAPFGSCDRPNAVHAIDFKGWFRTRDGARCNPLTMSDLFSRYLLCCEHLERGTAAAVWAVLEQVWREYGMPEAIRSDNGPPFASTGLGGLSWLSIRLSKLGIRLQRIRPGHPEQNGRHERMHRTMQMEVAATPAATIRSQQAALARFKYEFNWERPHEALGQRTPGSVYVKSLRPFPTRLPEVVYPDQFECRRVRINGEIKWSGRTLYLGQVLRGELIGLCPLDDGLWALYFGPNLLGVLNQRRWRIDRKTAGYPGTPNLLPMCPV